jgi:HK97 family phage prohead protease
MSTMISERAEARVFTPELREVETTLSLSMMRGLAVPYLEWANIGWFMESFDPGSFAKSIREAAADLPLNLFHENRSFPIGAADEWEEESSGLYGIWRLDDSTEAQRAARLAEKRMLTGMSIEFQPIRSEWTEAREFNPDLGPDYMDKVLRKEARLGAVALVQTPAYKSAGVQLVRSADSRRREVQGTPVLDAMKAATDALRGGVR